MKDLVPKTMEGYFKIECLDNNNNVIDVFEDHNTIMRSARRSMAEIFLNLSNQNKKFANKLVLGTEGGYTSDFVPKTESVGFNKNKPVQKLYAEEFNESTNTYMLGTSVNIPKFTVVKISNDNTYYRFIKDLPEAQTRVILSRDILDDPNWFIKCFKPYTYSVYFDIVNVNSSGIGYDGNNLALPESASQGCSVKAYIDESGAELDNSTCVFEVVIPKNVANSQHTNGEADYTGNISVFTEAALYVNDRIFSMKTFPGKVKDDTSSIKITWKIIF